MHGASTVLSLESLYHSSWQGTQSSQHTLYSWGNHQNLLKLSPVSERSAYPLQNYLCFTSLISGFEFWPQTYSLWQALDWGLLSKILASTKMGGPRVPNGQLSRVPWPGNSWMPFTFQPALQALQQPHKHSHSLQLATHTQLAHQNCFHANVKASTWANLEIIWLNQNVSKHN